MDKLQIHENGKSKGPVEIPETTSRRVSSQFQPSSPQIQPDNQRSQSSGNLQTLESYFSLLSFADSNHLQNSNQILPNSNSILHNQSNQVINGADVDGGYGLPHHRAIYDHSWSDIESLLNWNDSVSGSYVNLGEGSSSMTPHNNGFFNQNFKDCSYVNPGEGSSSMTHHNNGFFNQNFKDCSYVNPGEGSSSMTHHNNGFFNQNLQDYLYPSRYSFFNQRPWDGLTNGFGSAINNTQRNNGSFSYNHDPSPSMNSENRSMLSRAKDPLFSKYLQKMIAESPREIFDTIFKDLKDHVCDLIEDSFGSEVIQSLMMNCSSEQLTMIVDKVTENIPRFASICSSPLGSRVIQLLLRCVHSEDQIRRIVETISRLVNTLARNTNVQGVIVKCFEKFDLPQCWNLVIAIAQNIRLIAKDKKGCLMLQNLLMDYGLLMQPLIYAIISNALPLCHDSSGNYVVQRVIVIVDLRVASHIMILLRNNYVDLSCDKHGSHVVQRLLQIKGIETTWIVLELLQHMNTLVVHEYGNYVIQTAWDVSKGYMRGELLRNIEPYIPSMRCNMYGIKILQKMKL